MYPTLLTIGSTTLSSFSIFLILAWCVVSFVFWKSLRDDAILEESIFDLTFYGTIVAFAASRAWFVFLNWSQFSSSLLKIFALWVAPGLSLIAGVVGSLGIMMIGAKRMKIRIGIVLDAIGIALPGALIVGSVGSFLDGGSIGKVAGVAWAVRYVGVSEPRHPVQLYMIAFLICVLLVVGMVSETARRKKWSRGISGLTFFFFWSIAVFVLEFFTQGTVYWYGVSADGWSALLLFCMTIGVWLIYAEGKSTVMNCLRGARRGIMSFTNTIYAKFPKRSIE